MDLIEKAKSYYRAYERHNPDYVAGELAEGFTFTSPFDDHIGRAEIFVAAGRQSRTMGRRCTRSSTFSVSPRMASG